MAMRSTGRRRGLRRPSSDFIGKARDEAATQVTRIGLTFLGTSAFCLLSLLSPDSALLGGSERINVPFAGPVSFFGFMLLGPAVLIVLRVYLQIYVEHSERLDRLARSMSIMPMLVPPLQNPLIRYFSGLIFYLLLPLTMLLFAWKAAVFSAWGLGLLCVALGVIASHVMLWLNKFRKLWPLSLKVWTSVGAVIVVSVVFSFVVPEHPPGVRRPFNLDGANLSDQWLVGADLRDAHLSRTNLRGATLIGHADLRGADLFNANLKDATLIDADLSRANLRNATLIDSNLRGANLKDATLIDADLSRTNLKFANLSDAILGGANLKYAILSDADLRLAILNGADLSGADLKGDLSYLRGEPVYLNGAKNLTQTQLDEACGDANTKLPEGLTLKAMCRPPKLHAD
jgi:hypothetical protein